MIEDWPELSEEEEQRENAACIERFERMLRSGGCAYFDEDEYIFIIDHYMLQEDLDKAEIAMKRSTEQFPDRMSLQLRRVGLLSALLQTKEALKLLREIDRQNPHADGTCLYEEAILYLDLQQWDASEEKFNAILRLPECERKEVLRDPNFYNDLSDLYEGKGELYKAIEAKQHAVHKGSAQTEELAYLVARLRENGSIEESVRFFRERVEANPLSELDWLCMGKTYMEDGKINEAREALDNALALGKEDSEANIDYATLLAMEGKINESEAQLEQYFQLHGSNILDKMRCYNQIARCTYEHHQTACCLYFSQKSMDLNPDEAYGHALSALALGELGEYARGLEELEKAISMEPDEIQHWLLRSEYLMQLERTEEIEASLKECCTHFPNESKAWLAYSYYLVGIGDTDKAISLLRFAANIDNQPLYIYRIANYFFLKGDDINGMYYLNMAYTAAPEHLDDFIDFDDNILKNPAVINYFNYIQNKNA